METEIRCQLNPWGPMSARGIAEKSRFIDGLPCSVGGRHDTEVGYSEDLSLSCGSIEFPTQSVHVGSGDVKKLSHTTPIFYPTICHSQSSRSLAQCLEKRESQALETPHRRDRSGLRICGLCSDLAHLTHIGLNLQWLPLQALIVISTYKDFLFAECSVLAFEGNDTLVFRSASQLHPLLEFLNHSFACHYSCVMTAFLHSRDKFSREKTYSSVLYARTKQLLLQLALHYLHMVTCRGRPEIHAGKHSDPLGARRRVGKTDDDRICDLSKVLPAILK
ncbi:hypothetical protein KC321_g80 [Hortaea werneckii]|nr:hypothetical protein KC321_g80 [Hortaea werneckii]